MLKKEKFKFKETITGKTVDGREYTHIREVSEQQILEGSAEDLSDFPTEQADRQTQNNVYDRVRKRIWPTLKKVVRAVINFLIRYSVCLLLDLLNEII